MNALNAYLTKARIAKGLTQIQLAKKLGYSSAQFVSNWERDLCGVPLKKLKRLIVILHLDEDILFEYLMDDFKKTVKRELGIK